MAKDSEVIAFTVEDYLINKVRFGVPRKALLPILVDRGIAPGESYLSCDRDSVRLAYADLLKWYILGARKVNNTSDSDNGWTHTEGGYELSSDDISVLKAEANAIYEELDSTSVIRKKTSFRVISHGVKRANVSPDGYYVPHLIK